MRDSILRTPLHDAVQYGSVRLTRALIEQCSELDVADINGVTPLSLAVRNREVAIVKLLLKFCLGRLQVKPRLILGFFYQIYVNLYDFQ